MLEIYQEIIRVIGGGERAALATVINSDGSVPRLAGAKMLLREDGTSIGTVGGGGAEEQTRREAPGVIRSGQARTTMSIRDGEIIKQAQNHAGLKKKRERENLSRFCVTTR